MAPVVRAAGLVKRYGAFTDVDGVSMKRRLTIARALINAPALDYLERDPALVYLHRPAGLEDVFLRLTGRDLRD